MRTVLLTALLMTCGTVSAQGVLERLRNRLENAPLLDPVPPPAPVTPGLVGERPILGFQAEERTEDGVSSVYVENVQPDTAAAKAGLQPGDQIVKIGDQEIATIEDVTLFMTKRKVGDEVELQVLREGAPVVTTATLQANPKILARPTLPGGPATPAPLPPAAPGVLPPADLAPMQHGRLGVVVENEATTPGRVHARIANIVPGSAADQAGLRVGDVIDSIDAVAIAGALDVQQRMRTTRPGQEVVVGIIRDGVASQLNVRLMGPAPVLTPIPPAEVGATADLPPQIIANPAPAPAMPNSADTERQALGELVEVLQQRIDELEKRVAELESE
ncbi:PDZ domain-containing protein [Roseimaritima ulvae]|uniref:Regulator of sigma-E protease RseP n=1 Tax=Roseimaritima ulvae TaxID=980254 RepID=A0A5B9QJ73_9BACT|nr:PDZ domain-containing protein [Roseimaritima ulvae]QEG39157.1 Regulator of sigma-E protease RseP [Roseimaritima ulvae]